MFDRSRRSEPPVLSDERKRLVLRYMTDRLEEDVEDASAEETLEQGLRAPHSENGSALRAVPSEPAPAVDRPRRGRPPGRKARRQVHFHVDPEEDRLLLAAAGQFGSQQKGLIAALRALEDASALLERVSFLEVECARLRELLGEAEAVFNKSRNGS